MQKPQDNYARIEEYEMGDDYESFYDLYACGACGK